MELKSVLTILVLLCVHIGFAQNMISGKVIDAESKEPLPFASIIFNNSSSFGTTTDIDGKFSYSGKAEVTTITCSYVGYTNQSLTVGSQKQGLVIELSVADNVLEEVVITPTEDPAYGVMRKVIANKELNDPENINSFKYNCYNKVIYDFKSKNWNDSIEIKKMLKNGHIFMMESVTERKYLKPNLSEERVLATKVSGFKDPSFASLATDLQPFSFYKDNIPFLNNNYLNPISEGSLNKYRFTMQDTLYRDKDTIYIISYKPRPRKNFDGLTGLLYINTNKYAVQNVTASPSNKGKIDISIRQQYTQTAEGYWFPEQLDFTLELREYPSPDFTLFIQGKSYIDSIAINPPLRKREFPIESVWIEEGAARKDSAYWQNSRREDLSTAEATTYRVIDSLGQEHNFDGLMRFTEKLVRGRIPVWKFDINLSKTLVYNKYEGARWGLGLYTNERLFERLTLGGFFGYGSRDYEWKYGGEIIYAFNKRKDFTVGAKYQDNLVEAGNHGYQFPLLNYYNFRSFLASQMDHIKESSFNVGFRGFRYTNWNIGFSHAQVMPTYQYEFVAPDSTYTRYNKSELSVNMRYAFGEKIINSFKQNVSAGTKYPILYLSYSRGIKNMFNGDFNYNKIEAAIEDSFFIKNIGKTSYRLEGGYVDRPLPYGLMFTGEGSYDEKYKIIIKNTFQTMLPYEFLSDRYVNLFTSHNFGRLLLRSELFQPIISIHNNLSWGDLGNTGSHQLLNFKTKDKLFAEAGLQLDNILRMNYMNLGYMGFGAGVYYRYGGYHLPDAGDNVAFKFTVNFTID